jgi:hypothetical protein
MQVVFELYHVLSILSTYVNVMSVPKKNLREHT